MAKRTENILDLLSQCPWWVSVVLSGIVYVALRFILPTIEFKGPFLKGLAGAAPRLAVPLGLTLVIPAPIAFFNSLRKKKLLDKQRDLDSIKCLSWKEFEELIAEAYPRKGYSVVENYGVGPDGGIDLVLRKAGNLFLVQCKHWKTQKVDVRVVREMYGLMAAERASGVIVITSGLFTQEAKTFAEDKAIDLVEGYQVADLISSAQRKPFPSANRIQPQQGETTCQNCGANVVLRVTPKGKNPGSKFWGCSNFPKCTFTREYTA
jgi:restriction system protein